MRACFFISYEYAYLNIKQTGGVKFPDYRTGPVDPKYGAADFIVKAGNSNSKRVTVVAETYGICWNVYNYLLGHLDSEIVMLHASKEPGLDQRLVITNYEELLSILKTGGFVVGFTEGPFAKLMEAIEQEGIRISKNSFSLYGGKNHITVWTSLQRD